MNIESLSFAVTLSAKMWDKHPQFSIWIDESPVVQSELPDENPHVFKFTHDLCEGAHSLKIRLENKTPSDTVKDSDDPVNFNIVKDMLLNIDNITIDDVSLGNLLWSAEYYLDTPYESQGQTVTKLDNCVNLGWNGTYTLNFTSPFYVWLLEKL